MPPKIWMESSSSAGNCWLATTNAMMPTRKKPSRFTRRRRHCTSSAAAESRSARGALIGDASRHRNPDTASCRRQTHQERFPVAPRALSSGASKTTATIPVPDSTLTTVQSNKEDRFQHQPARAELPPRPKAAASTSQRARQGRCRGRLRSEMVDPHSISIFPPEFPALKMAALSFNHYFFQRLGGHLCCKRDAKCRVAGVKSFGWSLWEWACRSELGAILEVTTELGRFGGTRLKPVPPQSPFAPATLFLLRVSSSRKWTRTNSGSRESSSKSSISRRGRPGTSAGTRSAARDDGAATPRGC